ncbi:MAG: GGDEF and EAL domain-containing protein [Clostridiales bacterium]|nr:GGDEF and EAL domain-containing protein [Clostridiales bacterium]
MDDFREMFYETNTGGKIPSGLPGGFFIYEAGGDEKILFAETNVVKLYGCETYEDFLEYTQGSFKNMVHPDDLNKIENQIQAQTIFGEQRHDYVRYRIKTKQGEVRYIEDFGHLLHWHGGKSFYYVFIVDVDKNEFFNRNRNSYAEAEILAVNNMTDELTGLLNMTFFYIRTQQVLNTPEGRRSPAAFIHFDIPNFKLYNERHGFKLGDEVLCDFAKIIKDEFPDDVCARFSDDHFFVFAFGERNEIIRKIENIYRNMLLNEDVNKKLRIKAGIYFADDKYTEIGIACDHARLACNSIKRRHDIYYCIYDDMLREDLKKQQYIVDHIEEAIENSYIKVFYQPVVRVESNKICGYEALVRWIDPNVGTFNPADFIETLEQFHLIHLIDMFVVRQVCSDYQRLNEVGEPVVPVSVNISRLDFELCDIFGFIYDTCKETGVPANMLDIEITESALNDNIGYIKSECKRMSDLGYQIWLDDFGSGYSSLNTLTEYSFDVLKLDLVFMRNLKNNPKTGTLMNFIVKGATSMGLSTLCEGVESDEQLKFLKKIGCNRAQGYLFGKPMPMDESRAHTSEKGMAWED